MPTAAKLVGAILFAALAWSVSVQILALVPGGRTFTWFAPMNGVLGAIMGWQIMGARAGEGFVPATGYGLTTVFAIAFWALLLWSGHEMMNRAVRGRYDGPGEALAGMADLMMSYAVLMSAPSAVGPLVVGSVFCAAIVEFFSRRWS